MRNDFGYGSPIKTHATLPNKTAQAARHLLYTHGGL
jgi:hypothetical protein